MLFLYLLVSLDVILIFKIVILHIFLQGENKSTCAFETPSGAYIALHFLNFLLFLFCY